MTVSIVPSTGFSTARYALALAWASAADSSAAPMRGWPASPCAIPRSTWERIMPELPRPRIIAQ